MNDNAKELLPSENEVPYSGDLSSAIVKRIEDDIEDAGVLRSWRKIVAMVMGITAGVFYLVLLGFLACLCFCDSIAHRILVAPTVAVAIIVVLAAVPSLILASVARAVFGKHSAVDSPYSPLQSIIQLMKEMKS